MSTKSKLINNNQKLNSNNLKLMAFKNAFLRKKLAGINDEEFETYNAYVEECKKIAKSKISE